jgi:tetratricopeptide (TPR) repeat protein
MNNKLKFFISMIILVFVFSTLTFAGGEWFKLYDNGKKAMKNGNYQRASELFQKALKSKSNDIQRVRTYGMHFSEYFPHRELGICYYHLGDVASARQQLEISLSMEPTQRANDFLSKLKQGAAPQRKKDNKIMKKPEVTLPNPPIEEKSDMLLGQKTIKLVGERMNIAVFPFENKGASRDLGEIILDKMITVLYNQGRFEMMERDKLNRVLEEQTLGQAGVIDAASAATIGKGIGVDAIVIGSVAASSSGALSIDARVIDTESAAIIVAQDIYTGGSDAQSVKNAVENLAKKITEDLPLIQGFIIKIDGDDLILDVGRNAGLKKGMKCHVYREGKEIKHPISGEILGKETKILGEILVTDIFDKYSVSKILNKELGSAISLGDKFLTK